MTNISSSTESIPNSVNPVQNITPPIDATPVSVIPGVTPKKRNYLPWILGILVLVIILVASFLILTGKSKLTPTGSLTQSPVLQEQNAVDATNIDISSWKTYSNPGLGISFQYPSNWVLNMDDKNAILTIKADPIVRSSGIEISSIDRKSYVSLDSWLAQENKKCEAGKKLAEETGGDSDCVAYSRLGERKINNFDSPKVLWSCCGSGPTIRYFIEGDPDKIYLIDLFQDWDNFNLNTTGDYDEDNSKLAKIYQQILSTFKFIDVNLNRNNSIKNNPQVKLFTSNKLGINLYYLPGQHDGVKEEGNRIYVTSGRSEQFVEIFSKKENETMVDAIDRALLLKFDKEKCVVISKTALPRGVHYEIEDKTRQYVDDEYYCPVDYSQANGARYFLEDENDKTKFYFYDLGQYAAAWEVEQWKP